MPKRFMDCYYSSEWEALKESSGMRRRGFQCEFLGETPLGFKVRTW